MTKDRLNELRRTQNQNGAIAIHVDDPSPDTGKDAADLRKTFERAEVVGQWLEQLESNTQTVRVYLRRLDDMQYNQKDVQDKLQSLFQNNTSIAQKISGKLKEVDLEMAKIKLETAEGRIKTIQHSTLKTRFQQAFQQSIKELENFKNIQKQGIKAQLNAKGGIQVSDEELTALLDEGQDLQVFTENILAETAEAKRILADVEERHQQLLQIERMLIEVRDLFVQMSILVDTQQELLDRIEYQAQTATDYVGAVDLGKVRRSRKKYIRRKIYFILAIVLLIAIILILLFK